MRLIASIRAELGAPTPAARLGAALYSAVPGRYRQRVRGAQNRVARRYAFLRGVRVEVSGAGNTVDLGIGSALSDLLVRIRGSRNRLVIGPRATVSGELWIEGDDCVLTIGARTGIYSAHVAATERGGHVEIGDDCLIAPGVEVRNGDSHSIVDLATGSRINPPRDVSIGRHVWLCGGCRVLKGVQIGDGSIVGAGAVVTTSIPENVLAVGVPARIIREGLTWRDEWV